jgi:predicted methyltransferase
LFGIEHFAHNKYNLIIFNNHYHNLYESILDKVKFLSNTKNVLKKETGRLFLIMDHCASVGRGTLYATYGGKCRIDETVVQKDAEEADYAVDKEESDLIADSTDVKSSNVYSTPMQSTNHFCLLLRDALF